MAGNGLTDEQVEQFVEDGFVRLERVVPPEIVTSGRQVIWADLGQSPHDPSTWMEPVIRLLPSDDRPFETAFDNPRLRAAFDQLVGVGSWLRRPHLGLFVVRFPHQSEPSDTGWHIDASFSADHESTGAFDFSRSRVNVFSGGRALLLLFLFSDVGPEDAPTRIRAGSHLDVPSILLPAGSDGLPFADASALAERASASRPVDVATGNGGDVYLCHPFLVHAAQSIRGTVPRFLAQPPLTSRTPLIIDRSDGAYSLVETSIRRGLQLGSRDEPQNG